MDFGTVLNKLDKKNNSAGYDSPASFSKDVNRVFSNVLKVWEPGQEIADAAGRLQLWWIQKWTELVPLLMRMKADDDGNPEKENTDPSNLGEDGEGPPSGYVHNERGEDFQDQIGMPDEENMRSWSHHHTTDTVDGKQLVSYRAFIGISAVVCSPIVWNYTKCRPHLSCRDAWIRSSLFCLWSGSDLESHSAKTTRR